MSKKKIGSKRSARRPTKVEIAKMKVLSDLGLTNNAIGENLGKSHHTVKKYLESEVYTDPNIDALVKKIAEKELEDLVLLGAKSRKRLHTLLDEDKTSPIESCAIMDRSFQQVRLLQNKSTQNYGLAAIIRRAMEDPEEESDRKKKERGEAQGASQAPQEKAEKDGAGKPFPSAGRENPIEIL